MTEPTEQERREINETLARARGWRWPDCPQGQRLDKWLSLRQQDGRMLPPGKKLQKDLSMPPDFTRDPAASRELVGWLANTQEPEVIQAFAARVRTAVSPFTPKMISLTEAVWMMAADPLTIARAAREAIGGNNGAK